MGMGVLFNFRKWLMSHKDGWGVPLSFLGTFMDKVFDLKGHSILSKREDLEGKAEATSLQVSLVLLSNISKPVGFEIVGSLNLKGLVENSRIHVMEWQL